MKAIVWGYVQRKGGAGKSTLHQLMAGYLEYILGKKVLVIDADEQETLYEERQDDLMMNPDINENLCYDLVRMVPDDVIEYVKANRNNYDYIMVDLSGTFTTKGNVLAYAIMDKMIIPTSVQKKEMSKSIDFHRLIIEKINPARKKMGMPDTEIIVQLNHVNKMVGAYKELRASIVALNGKVSEEAEKNYRGEGSDVYAYPFEFIDADITKADVKLGDMINTVLNNDMLEVMSHYESECEIITTYLNK